MEGTTRGGGRDATERGKRRRSDETRDSAEASTSKKHAGAEESGKRASKRIPDLLHTRPKIREGEHAGEDRPKKGTLGTNIHLKANYFRLMRRAEWSLYKYHVTFEPEVLLARVRSALIFIHKPIFGGYLFDGTQLFLTRRMEEDQLELVSANREGVEHRIKLRFTKEIHMNENESLQVLNLILRRAMQGLQLKLVQRNYYDPQAAINLPQYNMQLWPGYDTSIRQHEYDILLNVDVSNKVMRTDTVYDLMNEARRGGNFRAEFQQKVLGITVLTDFNNLTYRIDDVDFDKSPSSTFPRGGQQVTFIAYYLEKYRIRIRDENQPLLVSRARERSIRGGNSQPILLIPELCRMTGLSERQRTDHGLKTAMRPYTAMGPPNRIERLMEFNRRLRGTPNSMATLTEWQLNLDRELVQIDGREFNSQPIYFAEGAEARSARANWDAELRNQQLFDARPLKRFYFIHTERLDKESQSFLTCLIRLARNMGFMIGTPRILAFSNDTQLVRNLDTAAMENPEMILCVIDNNRADSYSKIKKKLCFEYGIPSQVVTRKSISRPNIDSVVTKIAIQMCTKLGGAPWLPGIPVAGIMTIGFDVSTDTTDKRKSFAALVATMDLQQGARMNRATHGVNFYSAVSQHMDSNGLSTDLSLNVVRALHAYRDQHGTLPKKIIIYRGGVGDGQIGYVHDIEVQTLEKHLDKIYNQMDLKPELLFIIVNKRINTRIFTSDRKNPPAGTIVDDVITQPERYDFYLVPQTITQGTASPTLYNVIHDTTTDMSPSRVQLWTYKMCHIYYNWSGTVRVPAVMQYATKLSFLIANSIHQMPHNDLANKLYFL